MPDLGKAVYTLVLNTTEFDSGLAKSEAKAIASTNKIAAATGRVDIAFVDAGRAAVGAGVEMAAGMAKGAAGAVAVDTAAERARGSIEKMGNSYKGSGNKASSAGKQTVTALNDIQRSARRIDTSHIMKPLLNDVRQLRTEAAALTKQLASIPKIPGGLGGGAHPLQGMRDGLSRSASRTASHAGMLGLGALYLTIKGGIDDLKANNIAMAEVEAHLKSTGRVAGVTGAHIEMLGRKYEKLAGVEGEATASAAALLLTFPNIRNQAGKMNDVFDQTVNATQNIAKAFHKDLPQAAIIVGKALGDPAKGLLALRRIGVTFSQGQIDVVKKLVATGNTLQAQKLILKELERQTGGTAAAYGRTFAGQLDIARVALKGNAAVMVQSLLPAFLKFVGALGTLSSFLSRHTTAVKWVLTAYITWKVFLLGFAAVQKTVAAATGIMTAANWALGRSAKGATGSLIAQATAEKAVGTSATVAATQVGGLRTSLGALSKIAAIAIPITVAYNVIGNWGQYKKLVDEGTPGSAALLALTGSTWGSEKWFAPKGQRGWKSPVDIKYEGWKDPPKDRKPPRGTAADRTVFWDAKMQAWIDPRTGKPHNDQSRANNSWWESRPKGREFEQPKQGSVSRMRAQLGPDVSVRNGGIKPPPPKPVPLPLDTQLAQARAQGNKSAQVEILRKQIAQYNKDIALQTRLYKTDVKNRKAHADALTRLYGERLSAQADINAILEGNKPKGAAVDSLGKRWMVLQGNLADASRTKSKKDDLKVLGQEKTYLENLIPRSKGAVLLKAKQKLAAVTATIKRINAGLTKDLRKAKEDDLLAKEQQLKNAVAAASNKTDSQTQGTVGFERALEREKQAYQNLINFDAKRAKMAGEGTKEAARWNAKKLAAQKQLLALTKLQKRKEQDLAKELMTMFLSTRAGFFSSFGPNVFTQGSDGSRQTATSSSPLPSQTSDVLEGLGHLNQGQQRNLYNLVGKGTGGPDTYGNYLQTKGYASGGVIAGRGHRDTVPAMLTPGEVVLSRKQVSGLGGALGTGANPHALFSRVQKFNKGGVVAARNYLGMKGMSYKYAPGKKDPSNWNAISVVDGNGVTYRTYQKGTPGYDMLVGHVGKGGGRRSVGSALGGLKSYAGDVVRAVPKAYDAVTKGNKAIQNAADRAARSFYKNPKGTLKRGGKYAMGDRLLPDLDKVGGAAFGLRPSTAAIGYGNFLTGGKLGMSKTRRGEWNAFGQAMGPFVGFGGMGAGFGAGARYAGQRSKAGVAAYRAGRGSGNAHGAAASVKAYGGGTFLGDLGAYSPSTGYMVSVGKHEKQVRGNMSAAKMDKYARRKRAHLGTAKGTGRVGAWSEKGLGFLDVSRRIPDLQEALRVGRREGQEAIWDIKSGTSIPTGLTREQADLIKFKLKHPRLVAAGKRIYQGHPRGLRSQRGSLLGNADHVAATRWTTNGLSADHFNKLENALDNRLEGPAPWGRGGYEAEFFRMTQDAWEGLSYSAREKKRSAAMRDTKGNPNPFNSAEHSMARAALRHLRPASATGGARTPETSLVQSYKEGVLQGLLVVRRQNDNWDVPYAGGSSGGGLSAFQHVLHMAHKGKAQKLSWDSVQGRTAELYRKLGMPETRPDSHQFYLLPDEIDHIAKNGWRSFKDFRSVDRANEGPQGDWARQARQAAERQEARERARRATTGTTATAPVPHLPGGTMQPPRRIRGAGRQIRGQLRMFGGFLADETGTLNIGAGRRGRGTLGSPPFMEGRNAGRGKFGSSVGMGTLADADFVSIATEMIANAPKHGVLMKGSLSAYNTVESLASQLKHVHEEAVLGGKLGGKNWYAATARRDVKAFAQREGVTPLQAAQILAVYSVKTEPGQNMVNAASAIRQWKANKKISGLTYNAINDRAVDVLEGRGWTTKAQKTSNYWRNIAQHFTPKSQWEKLGINPKGVTNDRWVANMWTGKDVVSDAEYNVFTDATQRIAEKMGWSPQQVQAASWVTYKARGLMETQKKLYPPTEAGWKKAVAQAKKGYDSGLTDSAGAVKGLKSDKHGYLPGGKRVKMARGGFVPGTGNGDTVDARLTPGELVINRLQQRRLMDVLDIRSGSATSTPAAERANVTVNQHFPHPPTGDGTREAHMATIAMRSQMDG